MLTEAEKTWLEEREYAEAVEYGHYSCPSCKWLGQEDNVCIFRRCLIFDPKWQDVAEFEARVAAKLTGLNAAELPCYPNFLCPFSAKHIGSCKACYLKHARLAVEAEMEENNE
jgi:hypothetical protein